MPGHFQPSPVFSEQLESHRFGVRLRKPDSSTGLQNPQDFPSGLPGPVQMLEDVTQCDLFEIIGGKMRIREYTISHVEAGHPRVRGRMVVRFKPGRIKSEPLRNQKKSAVAAADIEQGGMGDAGRGE